MKITQTNQVIETMRKLGGFATFGKLNATIDFSHWKTLTPQASVRRIVQKSNAFFRIRPGLWGLSDQKASVLARLELSEKDVEQEKRNPDFTHAYFQGLLVEIGKFTSQPRYPLITFIPAQDKSKLYIGHPLGKVADLTKLPAFSYPEITRFAHTVDVIWFNERRMPSSFFEVEHSTDIKNSLSKFFELQDFNSKFYIVADISRKRQFYDLIEKSQFSPIKKRVEFWDYNSVIKEHTNKYELSKLKIHF